MDLNRNENVAFAVSNRNIGSLEEYIRMITNIYSSSDVKRDHWLTKREKDFFVATVYHVINGDTNPISDYSIRIYKKYFNKDTHKGQISDYINKNRKKGWIRYNIHTKVVEIPAIFHGIDPNSDQFQFNLNFTYEQIDRSNTE